MSFLQRAILRKINVYKHLITDNWPRQLSGMTNREVIDWSCSAQTSKTLLYRIDGAIAKGHLNKNTSNVIISVGMNDYALFNIMTQLGLKANRYTKSF